MLEVSRDTVVAGEEVTLTLKKKSSSTPDFKGFLIQGKDNDGNTVVGEFTQLR